MTVSEPATRRPPEPPASTDPHQPAGPPGDPAADDVRRRSLRRMKVVATGLLVAAAVTFAVARTFDGTLAGYVEAFAEAAMVGALADWFAVTALFRHPLGLPIPHTAIIPERKDEIGKGLGAFVQGNFLSGPVIAEKLASVGVGAQLGRWLTEPDNARKLGESLGDAVQGTFEVLRDEDVAPVVEHMITERVAAVPAAAMASRLLDLAVAEGHHQAAFDSMLVGAEGFLDRNAEQLRARMDHESPWWVPEAVDDKIYAKLSSGAKRFLTEVAEDPDHEVRRHFDERVRELSERLRTSPELEARAEELKAQLLAHPSLRAWGSTLWQQVKGSVVTASADPDSELRRRAEGGIVRLGETIGTDPELRAKIDGWVERSVLYVLDQYREEVADLIAGTVARWDADDASRRIELQVGRDLQFIRINGTVVGGLVGVLIHAAVTIW